MNHRGIGSQLHFGRCLAIMALIDTLSFGGRRTIVFRVLMTVRGGVYIEIVVVLTAGRVPSLQLRSVL